MTIAFLFILYALALSAVLSRRGVRTTHEISVGVERPRTRVLIVGATGGTGRQLVAQALERGHVVTALVRNPAKLQIEHPQLRVVQGDAGTRIARAMPIEMTLGCRRTTGCYGNRRSGATGSRYGVLPGRTLTANQTIPAPMSVRMVADTRYEVNEC